MSVHLQIAEQVKNHRQAQKEFLKLDAVREQIIDQLLQQASVSEDISVQQLNAVTKQMNQIASKFQFPLRKEVTKEMVLSFAKK
ncbi:DUF2533 family protein [Halalkalibacter urbisdiaboli]|uniref:DUF2533 family protein n=1 Tax=Halalkalibacter urbisdiaboli TaxID=1960589 RepID=UPI000B446E1F|nr:DUF2533 family protein [Halalkalibacter urbisdiaboli]